LLAYCAWQAGDHALATIAVDRAEASQPGYSMARTVREAITITERLSPGLRDACCARVHDALNEARTSSARR
jgi:hypothetical protein